MSLSNKTLEFQQFSFQGSKCPRNLVFDYLINLTAHRQVSFGVPFPMSYLVSASFIHTYIILQLKDLQFLPMWSWVLLTGSYFSPWCCSPLDTRARLYTFCDFSYLCSEGHIITYIHTWNREVFQVVRPDSLRNHTSFWSLIWTSQNLNFHL